MLLIYLYANFIFSVFAWSTKRIYEQHENEGASKCHDEVNEIFLYWICYGNLIVYIILACIFMISLIKCGKKFNNND